MYYAVELGPYGDHADPRALAALARDAEQAGWDGFFIWDAMLHDPFDLPKPDPWIALAAVATSTERIRIGIMVTPLSRRRPWKVAREAATLDHLSNGRFILGVGLGDPPDEEFGWFGEEKDYKVKAKMLDEGLEILSGLWTGEPFSFDGEYYKLHEMRFIPKPLQSPRIPIWVGGWWPNKPPARRAARWDGSRISKLDGEMTPDDVRDMLAYIMRHRTSSAPFDVTVGGITPGDDPAAGAATVTRYEAAGATWWIEHIGPSSTADAVHNGSYVWPADDIIKRIRQGPPRIK